MKNLKAEMARFGVSNSDIQNVLGCSAKTVLNKLDGTTEFTMSEGFKIHDTFFPSLRLEYLFSKDSPSLQFQAEPESQQSSA